MPNLKIENSYCMLKLLDLVGEEFKKTNTLAYSLRFSLMIKKNFTVTFGKGMRESIHIFYLRILKRFRIWGRHASLMLSEHAR